MIKNKELIKGSITPAVIIIFGVFMAAIYGILLIVTMQVDFSYRQVAREEALSIAEAGINYYRWHLAHDPTDFTNGTGSPGPYVIDYRDPAGGLVGNYELEITPPTNGSTIVEVKSTGETVRFPGIKRTVTARFGSPSISQYAFLTNASSWYGEDITVTGAIHSNNGIRMDGENLSTTTSAKDVYICGSETGCSFPQWRPGIWGSGPNTDLWVFPAPAIDFSAMTVDLSKMQQNAQDEGLYLPPTNRNGYKIVFNGENFNVYTIRNLGYVNGYDSIDGCQRRYQIVNNQNLVGTYSIQDNNIIFVEDSLWVEGTINGRVTVAAARFPVQGNSVEVWITNNIVYDSYDGSDTFGLISQGDIYFARDIPANFKIDGALVAQNGKVIRHGYFSNCGSGGGVKDKLTMNGALISYNKSYWNIHLGGNLVSGFVEREINYISDLLYIPPPYFPTSGEYEMISWEED